MRKMIDGDISSLDEDVEVVSDRVCLLERKTNAPVWGGVLYTRSTARYRAVLTRMGRAGYASRKRKRQSNQTGWNGNGVAALLAFLLPVRCTWSGARRLVPKRASKAHPTPTTTRARGRRLSGAFPPPISVRLDRVDATTGLGGWTNKAWRLCMHPPAPSSR